MTPRLHRPGSRRVRATLYISADLLEEARNAAVHFAGNPLRMTLAQLTDNALRTELKGSRINSTTADFPERTDDLQGGRPIAA